MAGSGTWAIGFRFNSGLGMQYGWVRIKWLGCSDNQYIVKDYGWGDPGDQIKTGQTQLQEDETQVAPQAAKSPMPHRRPILKAHSAYSRSVPSGCKLG